MENQNKTTSSCTETNRITLQQKIKAVEKFLNGEASQVQISKEFNVTQTSVSRWCANKDKLIEMLQSSAGKKELRMRKNLPKKKKGNDSRENNKKQKRYHKAPARYGFDDTEEPEKTEEMPLCNVFAYGDPFLTTASQSSVEILHEHGYYVYPGMFSDNELENVRLSVSQLATNKWKNIFNRNKKRLQSKELALNFSCMAKTTKFMKTVNPDLHPRQWAVLKTEEDAMRQYAHTDYHPTRTLNLPNEQMPLLAFIPLEDDTKLYTWMPSRAILTRKLTNIKVKPSVLSFNRGDLVIFRGDLIHAGAEWNGSAKYCLHCYFHHTQVPFPDNETFQIVANTDPVFYHLSDIIDEEEEMFDEKEEEM